MSGKKEPTALLYGLPESQQVMVRIKQMELPLPPWPCLQGTIGMDRDATIQHPLVKRIDIIRPDIYLSVILLGVQFPEEKEMKFDVVFFDQ